MWSEEQVVFDKNMCRFCGLICKKLLCFPYDDASNEGNAIWQLIKRLVPLKISSLDRKPQQVCYECIATLEKYDTFISTCLANDNNYDNILDIVTTTENNNNNVESRTLPWAEDGKCKSENYHSGNIILMNKINENSNIENDNVYLLLDLNGKRVNIDSVLLKYNDNKTAKDGEAENETSDSKENVHNGKAQISDLRKKDDKVRPFKCKICDKSLARKSNLIYHLALHSKDRPYNCNECGKKFATFADLTQHKHIHSQSYSCNICKKCFVTKSKLERHEKSHTGIKDYACPVCKKKFAEKNNMINHISVHTGEKPFSCPVCKKSFRTQSHLTDHGKVHSAESPFRCTKCDKCFKWKSNLKEHMKCHSGEKFKCPDCNLEFSTRADYYRDRRKCRQLKKNETDLHLK